MAQIKYKKTRKNSKLSKKLIQKQTKVLKGGAWGRPPKYGAPPEIKQGVPGHEIKTPGPQRRYPGSAEPAGESSVRRYAKMFERMGMAQVPGTNSSMSGLGMMKQSAQAESDKAARAVKAQPDQAAKTAQAQAEEAARAARDAISDVVSGIPPDKMSREAPFVSQYAQRGSKSSPRSR
jgi:hypothetical protein